MASPRVLRVASFHGVAGTYRSIQAAVDAAQPGDWILVGPGDYHEDDDLADPPTAAQAALGDYGGVLIRTPGLHIRGMNRNRVIVDGTKASAPRACDPQTQYQQLGATVDHHHLDLSAGSSSTRSRPISPPWPTPAGVFPPTPGAAADDGSEPYAGGRRLNRIVTSLSPSSCAMLET